ncbi:MAG TPA: class I SAM-dependent methyltransferase [Phycisphaerae bacterium]|nr:class I SAM-dependent methyltransferase [Phycisphaerae bacterium]
MDYDKTKLPETYAKSREPLYGKAEAECLEVRETMRDDGTKYGLLLEHLGPCRRLVDIGAGWGQFLALAGQRVEEVWAVDECPDRVKDLHKACPKAKIVICQADRLELPDDYFDAVVTSQMLHEVKLFGDEGELAQALSEIRRVLTKGGRYLLLDHQDAGDGEVVVHLLEDQMATLGEFERKYRFYKAAHVAADSGKIRIFRRCLQDFLSKDWSLNSTMEEMEMKETHNVFEQHVTSELVTSTGLKVREWIGFSDITADLASHGGKLIEGDPWCRKFLLVTEKR